MSCDFCERLAMIHEIRKNENRRYECHACIETIGFNTESKKSSVLIDGLFDINYCPECGKKISELES